MLIYFWVYDIPQLTIETFLQGTVSQKALADWMNFCRDICTAEMLRHPVYLGGVGDIVEVDESKFGRKRKYARGLVRNEGKWIFG
jgi:hypothetical protein